MPLKIDLKPGEKFVINGAVLSVGRDGRSLLLQNEAMLLREKDVMQEEEADTPAKRIYFTIMLMYIDVRQRDKYEAQYQALVSDFSSALVIPEMREILIQIIKDVESGNFYKALKSCKSLFAAEEDLLKRSSASASKVKKS